MYIIGDIGNSEVKICIFSSKNKQIKKIVLVGDSYQLPPIIKESKKDSKDDVQDVDFEEVKED